MDVRGKKVERIVKLNLSKDVRKERDKSSNFFEQLEVLDFRDDLRYK